MIRQGIFSGNASEDSRKQWNSGKGKRKHEPEQQENAAALNRYVKRKQKMLAFLSKVVYSIICWCEKARIWYEVCWSSG